MKDIEQFVERLDETIRSLYDLSMACNDISYAEDLDLAQEALARMKARANKYMDAHDEEVDWPRIERSRRDNAEG